MSKTVGVIGSGFGGLAAGIRLQAAGHKVTIFEKRDRPGGRAYVWKEDGFTFDAGPTVITAPHCIEELFALAGKDIKDYVELIPVDPFYRLLWDDGFSFRYNADLEETIAQIRSKSPADVVGYTDFLAFTKEVFDEGYTKLAHVPFQNVWSMMRVAPQLVRLKSYRSVYDVVGAYIKDEHLRQAFSFHSLLVGGNPFETSAIYTLIHYLERTWGVFFPKGGTSALVSALVKLFEELGGKIELSSPIATVLTDLQNNVTGVRREDGTRVELDAVVSNADVLFTYDSLLRNNRHAKKKAAKLKKYSHSMSLFVLYFGTDKKYENVDHHTVLFGPRYKELLKEIFYGNELPNDFSLYLHAPSQTDPSLAPDGCGSFYVLSPVGHLGNLNIDWSVEGPRYAEKILDYLEEKLMPDLRSHVIKQRIFTPQDFKTELNAYHGSAFSIEPRLRQSAYFRVHNQDQDIPGLFFVGAGTHPGAGVPGVINSAKATAQIMLNGIL